MTRTMQSVVMILGLLASTALAGRGDDRAILTIDEDLDKNVTLLEISVEFSFGEIRVERGNPGKAITGYVRYDEEYLRPRIEYEVSGGIARFELTTRSRHKRWGVDLIRRDMESPESELYFTTRVPLNLDFTTGMGEARLDLGQLKVADLNLDNGMGETELNFSSLNGVQLRRISVDNGLGELVARNLSNARTRRLNFDCGLGSAELDFDGEEFRDMSVDVNVGLGSVVLWIPRGYNVTMEAEENFLSNINARDMVQKGRGYYRSENYDPSKPTLEITASVGLGNIDLRWIER